MWCSRCGTERPPGASYCPACGQAFAAAPEPGPPAPAPVKVTDAFEDSFSTLFSRKVLRPLAIMAVAALIGGAVTATMAAATIYAGFGTLSPHRLVDTGCFVDRSQSDPFGSQSSGPDYEMLPGCDAFPIDPNVPVLVGLGSLTVLVSMTVGLCLMLLLYRLSDQTLRSYRARLLPAPGRVLVTAGRLVGWGLVATAAVAASVAAIALVAYALASVIPGWLVALALVAAVAYAVVCHVAIWYVRFQLAVARMIIDDRPLPACWRELSLITLGRAWAFIGLSFAGSFAFSIGTNIASVAGAATGLVLLGVVGYVVLMGGQYLWSALFTTAAMRRLSAPAEPEPGVATPA
jgi:hypothetical protein